jgi:SAM-dependent methyltransferase
MARPTTARQLAGMRRDWDRRARENACYYVATGCEDWSEEEFYRSGEVHVDQHVRNDLGNICQGKDPKRMSVLEIGCGAGRITRALAGIFGQVYAVDISREMVRRARRAVRRFANVRVYRNNGRDLSVIRPSWRHRLLGRGDLKIDFIFSYIVFQHIPSREIIENYAREANRLLRPGGLFKFQVQGASTVEIEAENTWVGVPFTEREAREMAKRCGFELRYHQGAESQYYWLWFFKERELGACADGRRLP